MATKVIIAENETIDNALRNFRRKLQLDDVLKEAKNHESFMTRKAKLERKKRRKRAK